jgi:hypothetical protein
MSHRNQSFLFRQAADSGFDEGVPDVISLAAGKCIYIIHTNNLHLIKKRCFFAIMPFY